MDLISALIISIIAIILSGFFSGSEIAFVQSSRVRMEIDAQRGGLINNLLSTFAHNEDMFLSTLLVGNNIVLVIYGIAISALINPILNGWFGGNDALVLVTNTLFSTVIILFTGEFIPKTTFRVNPNMTMRIIALPLYLIYVVLYPVSLLISGISRGLMKLFGIDRGDDRSQTLTIDQLDDYIQHSIDSNPDDKAIENEVKIFRNAIDFTNTQIGECMTPRNEIVAVNIEATDRQALVSRFIDSGLSKIAVFRDDIDNIIGYIHVSELFNPDTDWKTSIKPVIYTPESMLANKMMSRMLAEKRSMVIVIDEFGGTSGLVTLEDLVEEIFGDFEDEHDKRKLVSRRLDDTTFEFSGRVEIEAINDEYGIKIPESDDYHTLAGFIIENLETLPPQGSTFTIGQFEITVVKRTDTRIELVRLHLTTETDK